MSFRSCLWMIAAIIALPGITLAQVVAGPFPAAPSPGGGNNYPSGQPAVAMLQRPPVPSDPLELVTGQAQPPQNAQERLAAINLLIKARELSNVRAQPYDLKTSFSVFFSGLSNGNWALEDVFSTPGRYRWTARGPSYTAADLYRDKLLYSDQQSDAIPLRLMQVREAIFFVYPVIGPNVPLRVAAARLGGLELQCVLVTPIFPVQSSVGPRRWDEMEYCVDPKSGLLITSSPAPGLYVHYDYTNALHFHEKVIPGAFTISAARQTVIEARTGSLADPPKEDPAFLETGNLKPLGLGPVMSPPRLLPLMTSPVAPDVVPLSSPGLQVVSVHGVRSPDGHFSEGEILASTNASLNKLALDRASQQMSTPPNLAQPGTTPELREVVFTFGFVPAATLRPPITFPPPVRPPSTSSQLPPTGPLGVPQAQPLPEGRIRLDGPSQESKLVSRVEPEYPPIARQAGIEGNVVLHVIVQRDGTVQQVVVVSGHPLLVRAAIDAVRQWRYQPTAVNGVPVEVDTTITVPFSLGAQPPAR